MDLKEYYENAWFSGVIDFIRFEHARRVGKRRKVKGKGHMSLLLSDITKMLF